jgi:hypothetical protein
VALASAAERQMARGLLEQSAPGGTVGGTPPPPLHLLDRALDRELTRACALVGEAAGAQAQVILAASAGSHPIPLLWEACNARAAQLCDQYGVELLLVEEDGQLRIRIDKAPGAARRPAAPSRWFSWWRRRRTERARGTR